MKLCAGACAMKKGSLAFSAALCGVTPQAQNTGTMSFGADLDAPLFGGPVPPTPKGIVPVFWACGVTPQSAAENARLPFFVAHAPAHSFITDLPAQALMNA